MIQRQRPLFRNFAVVPQTPFKTGVLNLVYGPAESTDDATYDDAKRHLSRPEQ